MATANANRPNDLMVDFCPGCWASYEGSRSQLEAEGLIEPGLDWPVGFGEKRWPGPGYSYQLRRVRAPWESARRRTAADYWRLIVRIERDRGWEGRLTIERMASDLQDEIYSQTAVGRRESELALRRVMAARDDKTFQGFMAAALGDAARA